MIGSTMIARTTPAGKTPRPVGDGVPKIGMKPSTLWSAGSIVERMTGARMRMPQSPRITLGTAATILGLSRALGEAIAVTQLIGAGVLVHANVFTTGDSLASRIAEQVIGAQSNKQLAALFYCAVILLGMELLVNFAAQLIVRRFERQQGLVH